MFLAILITAMISIASVVVSIVDGVICDIGKLSADMGDAFAIVAFDVGFVAKLGDGDFCGCEAWENFGAGGIVAVSLIEL